MDAEQSEMSNAADDPGRRNPPPGQSDPQPYPGDPYQDNPQPYPGTPYSPPYSPPYSGAPHDGDPQPYGAPFEAGHPPSYQGGGYAPAPPPYSAPPADPTQHPGGYATRPSGRPAAPDGKGFAGALFDMNFDHMVTPRLIKGTYLFAVLLSSMVAVAWLIVGFWLFHYGYLLTVFIVLFAPPAWLGSLIVVRIALEFVINQFKITEHLKAIREQREPR